MPSFFAACNIFRRLSKLETKVATFQEDVDKLTADVAAQGAVIAQVAALVNTDTATIADLKAQVAALQGQTSPNLAGLEAGIASLEQNNATLSAVLPPPPPPTPTA